MLTIDPARPILVGHDETGDDRPHRLTVWQPGPGGLESGRLGSEAFTALLADKTGDKLRELLALFIVDPGSVEDVHARPVVHHGRGFFTLAPTTT